MAPTMGKLRAACNKNSADFIPADVYPQNEILLPSKQGKVEVVKGDFYALSQNAQNFIIEHVSTRTF